MGIGKTVIELLDLAHSQNKNIYCNGFTGYEFIDISLHDDGSIEIFYVDFEDYAATWDFKDYNEARQWLTSEDGEGLGEMLFDYESK